MSDRENELEDALRWCLCHLPEPTRRIKGQNEAYFDGYQRALAASRPVPAGSPPPEQED